MTNLNDLVYLCNEVFDENSEPTKLEIEEQASRLGIDPVKESHLLNIAKQCLLEPLPFDWIPCYIEKDNNYFYYNKRNKTSQWEHPLDEYYRQIIDKTRSEDSSTGQDISLNIILDEDIPDNNMYHLKNNTYEKKVVAEKRTVRFKTPIEESLDLDNSEENMKFLGPIKLNTPYNSTPSTLQNLPQFSTTNTFESRSTASRSIFSKYNILPSKDELSRKPDLRENKNNNNDDDRIMNYDTGKENVRKIDITLTESSDRSESTSSEIHTENLKSDYNENAADIKKKDNFITTVQINKRKESNNILNDDCKSTTSDHFNEFQSIGTISSVQLAYNVRKEEVISDSGNSTAKDSKIVQSSIATNSLSATKNKVAEITQRYPLNQFINEPKLLKTKPEIESDKDIFDIKSNSFKSKFELTNNLNDEKQKLLDMTHIKVMIENHCDLIKNKLEDTIKIKENIFREEFSKQITEVIREQNGNLEKHMERQNELFTKNELELKTMLKKMQENADKFEERNNKYVQNVTNAEQMCAENLDKFQKDLDNYAEIFKNQIQSELDVMSNELKKEFCKNSEIITASWNQILESYKNNKLEEVKNSFEQTTENIKRETDIEIRQFNLELKEKLKVISEDKLNSVTEQLDIAIRDEIDLVKKRVSKNYQHDININTSLQKLQPKLYINSDDRESHLEYQSVNMRNINYDDIRKKIQYCSNELNDALKMVNEITSTSEYKDSNKCTVSCQTENIQNIHITHSKSRINEYPYPESSNMSIFNNLYDVNTKYADYWNPAKRSEENIYSNYMTTYSKNALSPLDILSQEESKVNVAEQNICRLIDTFNNLKYTNFYHIPNNANIHQNKFTNFYQSLTPKQITFNRTKDLREWLYEIDVKNKIN